MSLHPLLAQEHEKDPRPQATWVLGQACPTMGPLLYRTIKVEVYDWDRDGR